MKNLNTFKITSLSAILLAIVFCLSVRSVLAQSNGTDGLSPNRLFEEIAEMDSILFTAFNMRDLGAIKKVFAEDLEFYHDTGGLEGYEDTIESTSGLFNQNNDLRRKLIEGSLEVYPIPGYGAMEIGAHQFCHTENGVDDCGTFQFVHIWRKEEGAWKLSRVISYGH